MYIHEFHFLIVSMLHLKCLRKLDLILALIGAWSSIGSNDAFALL